ncbi:MAG: ABC transporter permease [Chloroflexota bacterium]|jgi:peptide/nickel transport system permease protein|nr:ABC transporter permease [Chloroflexota bacterium]
MSDLQQPQQQDPELIDKFEGEMHLDDARRVKGLSPGLLIFKRFIRNRLAVVGLVILVFMFTFSFIGPFFSPYGQTQVFTGIGSMARDYAGAIYNEELRYTVAEGENFAASERAQFLLARGNDENHFNVSGEDYYFVSENPNTYRIMQLDPVAEVLLGQINSLDDEPLSAEFISAYESAVDNDLESFEFEGQTYRIVEERKTSQISTEQDLALASLNVYDAYNEADLDVVDSLEFKLASERAIGKNADTFVIDDETYSVRYDDGQVTILDQDGDEFAAVSEIIVNPLDKDEFLTVAFKSAIREAIRDNVSEIEFTHKNGDTIEYKIVRVNRNYYIRKETPTELIRIYELPSAEHPLGLDNNGMDVMTRLMYGGRVSLLVGFIVVILEVTIGVIIGGISGYFGGAVDTAMMRFVDLVNSIPFYPVVIIFGSVMDTLQVDPMGRIFLLMAVLGILGWTGVARVVRGQILSLREQDFMVAAEATGIRTRHRILRHLVPNVMPLLIVQATAGLGGIIISEATLGFLGLGVKYPLASWGSIINVASDPYVMTNFWFMWIPAGTLILLTVLGFNFVGDGLRDAFDPRMNR